MSRWILACIAVMLLVACNEVPPVEEMLAAGDRSDGLPPPTAAQGDWPWWRGPTFDGKAPEGPTPPLEWDETRHVLWKVPVPGRGHASPIVVGDLVVVATADEQDERQLLVAFDRQSGQTRWQTELHRGGLMPKHNKNSHASATPACDGKHLYTAMINDGALWVTATDLSGKIVWQKKAGNFVPRHGYGSSPVLYKSLVIVAGDNLGAGFLAALHRQTGETVWRVPRGGVASYATPIVAHVAGRPQLLLHGSHQTASYDPDTGKQLWRCDGPTEVCACTMAFDDELVYSSGGYPERHLLCIRADGSGDVTDSHLVWKVSTRSQVCYVPSPLLHEGRLYVVNDDGIAVCFDAKNGQVLWNQRLGGNFSASPTLFGDRIYVPNEQGKTFVYRTGDDFELLATNELSEGALASPTMVGGRIYLRTSGHLYCIGQPASAE